MESKVIGDIKVTPDQLEFVENFIKDHNGDVLSRHQYKASKIWNFMIRMNNDNDLMNLIALKDQLIK